MGAQSSVLNIATTFKEPNYPSQRGQGVHLSAEHQDVAIRQLSQHLTLTEVGTRSVPLLKSKTERLPNSVMGGKLLDLKDVQTREGVRKEVSGFVLQGTYTLEDLLTQGKIRLPDQSLYSSVLEALISAGRELELLLEYPVIQGLDSVYILADGRICFGNPYQDPKYTEMQLENDSSPNLFTLLAGLEKIIPFVQANSTGFSDLKNFFQREAERYPSGFQGQVWEQYHQKVRQSLQLVFAVAMKLAVGDRTRLNFNMDGSLETNSLLNNIRVFESYYPPEQTQLLRKVLLNPINRI